MGKINDVGGDDFWDAGPGEVAAVEGRDEEKIVLFDDVDDEDEPESPRLWRLDLEE